MEHAADFLLQKGALLLGVLVVIITFFIRRVVETALPNLKKKADENSPQVTYLTEFARWWNSVILYALPVVTGSALAIVKPDWFLPESATKGDAFLYGMIIGWFSSFLYKVVRKTLKARTGIDPVPGVASVFPSSPPPPDDTSTKDDEAA